MSEIRFRKATDSDRDFLTEAILAAEKSGTETLSYSNIFGISEVAVFELIQNIFDEDIEGQEWNIGQFYIVEINGKQAACLSTWVEGKKGLSSGILKAQAMSYFLGDIWAASASKLKTAASIQIPRLHGALQLENVYTAPEFRGKGYIKQLILFCLNAEKEADKNLELAEIQLMAENPQALHSYTKCGFLERARTLSAEPDILNLLPGASRLSLTRRY